jgi:hypothetical protein
MGRPNLTENPDFREMLARLENRERIMREAKAECEVILRRAERETEEELLAALWFGLQKNLSQYALGKATGKTRAEHQRALVERARRWGNANGAEYAAKVAEGTETCMGWMWGPQVVGGWTPYVSPEGERFLVGFNANLNVEWHKPDGSIMSHDERNELPLEVEMFAQEKMENA